MVPTFAPIIRFMDWLSVMRPEFTKPTTMTVVADELWIAAVTTSPVIMPMNLLSVRLLSMVLRLFPARLLRDWPMTFIPNRNRLRPPIIVSKSKISMAFSTYDGAFETAAFKNCNCICNVSAV